VSDPRITNQHKYLDGVELFKRKWVNPRPDWDHDHCAFCWAKFAGPEVPETLHEGYATLNGEHWVCGECFADFQARFQWSVCSA